MNFKRNLKAIQMITLTTAALSACSHLKNLQNQVETNLPSELKNRFYHHEFVGTYIDNPETILGKLIYLYKINDSTIITKTSVIRYPANLGVISREEKPVLRASGFIETKNTNDIGLFFSAFNLSNSANSSDAAEVVVVDYRSAHINNDTINNFFNKTPRPILDVKTITIGSNTYYPEIVYYIRGVHITTVSAKFAKTFSTSTEASGTLFKMNNKFFQTTNNFTFDYKAGLTIEDVTSYVNNSPEMPLNERQTNALDRLKKIAPNNKITNLKINYAD